MKITMTEAPEISEMLNAVGEGFLSFAKEQSLLVDMTEICCMRDIAMRDIVKHLNDSGKWFVKTICENMECME